MHAVVCSFQILRRDFFKAARIIQQDDKQRFRCCQVFEMKECCTRCCSAVIAPCECKLHYEDFQRVYCYKPEGRDSIPDGSLGFFIDNPCSRAMTLWSTLPLTEMSTRDVSGWGGGGGLRWPARWADNLTTFMCRLARTGRLNPLEP
jgi:hypothetical protein